MKAKVKIQTNKNFLNNQNYILGNNEKKKILNKFFVEKNFKNTIISLNSISNTIYWSFKYIYLGILAYIMSYLYIWGKVSINEKTTYIGLFLITLIFFILGIKIKNNYKCTKIKKIYDYFFDTKIFDNYDNKKIQITANIVIPYITLFFILWNKNLFNSLFIFLILSVFFSVIFFQFIFNQEKNTNFSKKLLGINFFNILFLPLAIIYNAIYGFFSFIYTFILKGIKGYKIIKNTPKSNFFKKFEIIKENNAKNKFYEIKLKP